MMKSSRLPNVLWGTAATSLFLIGYFLGGEVGSGKNHGPSGGGAADTALGHSGTDRAASLASQDSAAGADELASNAPLSPEQMRARTFGVLSEINRVERIGHLCQLLEKVNKDNWQEVLDGFRRQRGTEGRGFNIEWELALERIGEVGGQDAITTLLASADGRVRGSANWVLAGWAAKDPTASLEWVKQQPDNIRAPLLEYFFKGLGRSAPKQAVEFALTLPVERARQHLPFAVYSAIQSGGFRGAEEMLAGVRTRTDVDDGVKNILFVTLAQTQIETGRANRDMMKPLSWLDPYIGQSFVGPYILKDLVTPAASADPAGMMEWAVSKRDRFTPVQEESAILAISRQWRSKDPAAFEQWITANAEHPQHDTILEDNLTAALAAGEFETAEKWRIAIRDPQRQAAAQEKVIAIQTLPSDASGGTMKYKDKEYSIQRPQPSSGTAQ